MNILDSLLIQNYNSKMIWKHSLRPDVYKRQVERSQPGDYTVYFDKVVFKTARRVIAAYINNLENYWEI